jgi:hypothetical protein
MARVVRGFEYLMGVLLEEATRSIRAVEGPDG